VRPDIIHTLIPVCNIMGAFAWKLAGKGVLVSSRLSLGNYRDSNRTLARFENLTDKYFRLIHCKSRGILEDVLAREPVHREQLRIVYNGIDLQKFNRRINRSDARARIGLPDSAVVIGTVANLKPYKGHSDIVNAAPVIVKQHPRAIFVFVGRDDGIQSDLMAEAAALQIEDRVRFLGERNDVQELMPGFDLLVSASHEEGFSNVLLEAMAARLPVVATRVGGNPEAVEDGVTGYLANPRDPADLGRVINQILGDSTQSTNMGEAGRGRVERLFSMQSMLKGMQDLYIEALGGTRSSKQ
jgi:glycosyltransferase involved in cell wall biosynthesis